MREEVESLLAQETRADRMLGAGAWEQAGIAGETASILHLTPGTQLGPYRVVSLLGHGGMGEVYRAKDTRLGRDVALKLLLPGRLLDPERRRRFVQEARSASALNHPHIMTFYDLAEAEGQQMLVLEYVSGKPLDKLIARKGLPLKEALTYAVQIADALGAAHKAGIVHRDLKPGNIMVTETGSIKLLDFGLAKLTEPAGEQDNPSAVQTREGVIVGTLSYMSPEQAEGRQVDARSDLFSFGCVLYEMITGQRPFAGDSVASTVSAILRDEPKPVTTVRSDVPGELDRIVRRCLRKDASRRFQNASDLHVALLEVQDEIGAERPAVNGLERRAIASRRRVPAWVLAVAIAATAGAAAVTYIQLRAARAPERQNAENARAAVPLTAYPGFQTQPTLSPDGSQVAFVWTGAGEENSDIYVKLVGPGEPLRLTTNPAWDESPAWSPDGRRIAFLRFNNQRVASVMVIPALGGAEQKIADITMRVPGTPTIVRRTKHVETAGDLAWSPDGKWIAFGGSPLGERDSGIWLLAADGNERRRLTTVTGQDFGHWAPAFSPDGRNIAFIRERSLSATSINVQPLLPGFRASGAPAEITGELGILGLAWTPSGSEVVFSAGGHLGMSRMWRVHVPPAPGGNATAPELLSFGERATGISVSNNGRLVYAAQFRDSNLWKAALDGARVSGNAPVLRSTFDEETPDYSPDGKRLAFASTRSGTEEIWIAGADGSNAAQMTSMRGPQCANPRWSPDGRSILFNSRREGSSDLYLLSPDTGQTRRITDDSAEEVEPRWSRDGRWIYFGSNRTGRIEVWKMPASGGAPARITKQGGTTASESPDRRFLYYAKDSGAPTSIWRVPVDGGKEEFVVGGLSYALNFAAGSRGLYFMTLGKSPHDTTIDFFEYTTGKRTTLLNVGKQSFVGMALSPDQKSLLYSVIDSAGANLMTVDNFR